MAIKRSSSYRIERKGFYPVGVDTKVDDKIVCVTQYQDGHPDGTKMGVVVQFELLDEFIRVLQEIQKDLTSAAGSASVVGQ